MCPSWASFSNFKSGGLGQPLWDFKKTKRTNFWRSFLWEEHAMGTKKTEMFKKSCRSALCEVISVDGHKKKTDLRNC